MMVSIAGKSASLLRRMLIIAAPPADAPPTSPGPAPGSTRSRPPVRPAEATALWRTGAVGQGPWLDRTAPGRPAPAESAVRFGPTGAQAASERAAAEVPSACRR